MRRMRNNNLENRIALVDRNQIKYLIILSPYGAF